jgi:hypothetical protein
VTAAAAFDCELSEEKLRAALDMLSLQRRTGTGRGRNGSRVTEQACHAAELPRS